MVFPASRITRLLPSLTYVQLPVFDKTLMGVFTQSNNKGSITPMWWRCVKISTVHKERLAKEEEKSCNFPQGISFKDHLIFPTAGISDHIRMFSGCSKRWILFILHPSTSNFLKSFPKLTWHPISVMFSALLIWLIESAVTLFTTLNLQGGESWGQVEQCRHHLIITAS